MERENQGPIDYDEEIEEKTYLLFNKVKIDGRMQMTISITDDEGVADVADYAFIIDGYDEEDLGFILGEILNFLRRCENDM